MPPLYIEPIYVRCGFTPPYVSSGSMRNGIFRMVAEMGDRVVVWVRIWSRVDQSPWYLYVPGWSGAVWSVKMPSDVSILSCGDLVSALKSPMRMMFGCWRMA